MEGDELNVPEESGNVPDDGPGNVPDNDQGNGPDQGNADVDEKEPTLKEALEEWEDGQRSAFDDPEPEPDPRDEELARYRERIESFEGERGDFEAAVRENLELAEDAHAFHDEVLDRVDAHDADRLLNHLADVTGADRDTLDLEVKMKLLEDADFREAADNRLYEPDRFNAMVSEFEDDLLEKYPNNHDSGLTAAVRAARDMPAPVDQGEYGELDWARMSSQEFARHSREVLSAHKAGRIKSKARKGGGWFTTSPD